MLDPKRLQLRAAFFQAIRRFFLEDGFLEVDTPIRQPLVIPEQNITHVPSGTHFLQSSPELYMKRLLASGCEQIFQICRCFRYGERGRLHLEEFVMLEWYRLDADYTNLMADCERLFQFLQSEILECHFPVSLDMPWSRISVEQAFQQYCTVTVEQALQQDRFDLLLVEKIEPNLGKGGPEFLYDYPLELASLARPKVDNPEKAERFELYMAGVELANGFSELTDPVLQRSRFKEEYSRMDNGNGKSPNMPELFLQDLGKIDTAAGIALGLDRLFMLLLGENNINKAVTFSSDEFDM